MQRTWMAAAGCAALIAMLAVAGAQQSEQQAPPPVPPPPASGAEAPESEGERGGADEADQPTSEEKLNELLRRRGERPMSEPMPSTRRGMERGVGGADGRREPPLPRLGEPTGPSTAAPGTSGPLRREGAFVLTRRGRMVRAPGDSRAWLFVFESEGAGAAPPMYLMPCRLLEDMEAIVEQHADGAVFVLSGRIYAYRGANYLLPTLVKLAPDRGNLQP